MGIQIQKHQLETPKIVNLPPHAFINTSTQSSTNCENGSTRCDCSKKLDFQLTTQSSFRCVQPVRQHTVYGGTRTYPKPTWKGETVWSKFLKKSTHENCPAAAFPVKIRELLGVRGFWQFSDYLVHLRTAKYHLKNRCERFTLSPKELEQHRSLQVEVEPSRCRNSTRASTLESVTNKTRKRLELSLGTIKMHTISVAIKHDWNSESFVSEKEDLRKKYKIDREKASDKINLPKHELFLHLKTLCKPNLFSNQNSWIN